MRWRCGSWGLGAAGLLALAGLPACSAVLGIKDLPGPSDAGGGADLDEDGGTPGRPEASTEAPDTGGGRTPDANDPAAVFLGTWQLSQGSQILSSCTFASNDQGPVAEPTTIALVWGRGSTTDLFGQYTGAGSTGCTIAANVENGVAVGVPGQTCTQMVPTQSGTETDIITLVSFTFTITGNTGHTLVKATDKDEATNAGCTVGDDATYVRQ